MATCGEALPCPFPSSDGLYCLRSIQSAPPKLQAAEFLSDYLGPEQTGTSALHAVRAMLFKCSSMTVHQLPSRKQLAMHL